MSLKSNVYKEMRAVTMELVRSGLAEEYNFPMIRDNDILWEKYADISQYMKDKEYVAIYELIEKDKNYNIKMPDGGIFQLMYRFKNKDELLEHRLAYYPSPNFEIYQNDSNLYDDDIIYGDILNKSVLPVIIRLDYSSIDIMSEVHHPYAHMTLGDYKNCRIPVISPIAPIKFVNFVVEHFYYIPSSNMDFNFEMKSNIKFEDSLHEIDKAKSRMLF